MGTAERVARYGLRVTCLRCRWEGRHFPAQGRLRKRRCRCGGPLFPSWMIEDERWEGKVVEKLRRERQRSRVFEIA